MVKERNWGIDLLRLLSMGMVMLLHILGHGGIHTTAVRFSAQYEISRFLETAAICAVNVYALISGYVGVHARHRFSGLISLWLQVVTYSVGLTALIGWLLPGTVTAETLKHAFFPVTYQQYWYFTAYFAVFFFTPFLNHLLNTLPRRKLQLLLLSLVFLFSLLPTLGNRDIFRTGNGFSALWLAALYLIGGYCRQFEVFRNRSAYKALGVYLACVLIAWGSRWILESRWLFEDHDLPGNYLVRYTSPTILLCAVALLALFAGLRVPEGLVRIVRVLAPLSFGVYLIHEQPLIRTHVIIDRFKDYASYSPPLMVGAILGTVCGLFLLCCAIEWLRARLFRLLHLPTLCEKAEQGLRRVCAWIGTRMTRT